MASWDCWDWNPSLGCIWSGYLTSLSLSLHIFKMYLAVHLPISVSGLIYTRLCPSNPEDLLRILCTSPSTACQQSPISLGCLLSLLPGTKLSELRSWLSFRTVPLNSGETRKGRPSWGISQQWILLALQHSSPAGGECNHLMISLSFSRQ